MMIQTALLPLPIFFFFNDTATTEIYTLSLHDALPICLKDQFRGSARESPFESDGYPRGGHRPESRQENWRSEEHTSELQSQSNLVLRLLLEKKKSTLFLILQCLDLLPTPFKGEELNSQ